MSIDLEWNEWNLHTVFDILESTLTIPKRGRVDQDALQKSLMADIIWVTLATPNAIIIIIAGKSSDRDNFALVFTPTMSCQKTLTFIGNPTITCDNSSDVGVSPTWTRTSLKITLNRPFEQDGMVWKMGLIWEEKLLHLPACIKVFLFSVY